MALSIDDLYGDVGMTDEAIRARTDRSLSPRGPSMLHDKMAALGLSERHEVLDAGCRDARHAVELVRRFGCRVIAIDPVAHNVAEARRVVAGEGLGGAVRVEQGRIEEIPCGDASVDFVWCRDVLNHVPDLAAALGACARVLRPAGAMLVFQTFATDLLEPREAERLYASLATNPDNMSPERFETKAREAGLAIAERDVIDSEWREHGEESGRRSTSAQLLRIARMRRARSEIIADIGQVPFETELADCHWGVYQMLGKLCPRVYVLRRA